MNQQTTCSFGQSVSSMTSIRIIDELERLIESHSLDVLSDDQVSKVFRVAERLAEYSISKLKDHISDSEATKKLLCHRYRNHEHEIFGVILLDNQHKVISYEEMFTGTIDSCSVFPREVVKLALKRNAAAVVLFHNHPSGKLEPSLSDIQITKRITDALSVVEIRVLDHVIVCQSSTYSFAEHGRL